MESLGAVKEMLSRTLMRDADSIQASDKLTELEGMDSLSFELTLAEMENYTGAQINTGDALSCKTVADLARLCDELQQQRKAG